MYTSDHRSLTPNLRKELLRGQRREIQRSDDEDECRDCCYEAFEFVPHEHHGPEPIFLFNLAAAWSNRCTH